MSLVNDDDDFQPRTNLYTTTTLLVALEWAASGAKLGLPLQVRFSTNECEEFKMIQESLLLGDRGVGASLPSVLPLNEPTFISSKGQEHVKVTQGAFSCQIQVPDTEQYSLRFFLDFVRDLWDKNYCFCS